MKYLFIPKDVFQEIVCSVLKAPAGFETGVTLFGTYVDRPSGSCLGVSEAVYDDTWPRSGYVVLAVADPGRRATHEPAHYSGDEDHANAIFRALQSALPGICWIGEIHVHPRGMTWLSSGDRTTVQQILTGTDGTLHPTEFIAGVMQRRNGTVDIYPVHFTRDRLDGSAMKFQVIDSNTSLIHQARLKVIEKGNEYDRRNIREKPQGSRDALPETRSDRWVREWRKRACRYDFQSWYR